ILVRKLGGKVAADQLRLGLLAAREIVATGVTVGAGGLEPALALATEYGQLIVRPLLDRLLQLGEHEPQRADAVLLACPHRPLQVDPDLIEYRHRRPRIRRDSDDRAPCGLARANIVARVDDTLYELYVAALAPFLAEAERLR